MCYNHQKYGGAFIKAERELRIPTHEPDTDNAGVGKYIAT